MKINGREPTEMEWLFGIERALKTRAYQDTESRGEAAMEFWEDLYRPALQHGMAEPFEDEDWAAEIEKPGRSPEELYAEARSFARELGLEYAEDQNMWRAIETGPDEVVQPDFYRSVDEHLKHPEAGGLEEVDAIAGIDRRGSPVAAVASTVYGLPVHFCRDKEDGLQWLTDSPPEHSYVLAVDDTVKSGSTRDEILDQLEEDYDMGFAALKKRTEWASTKSLGFYIEPSEDGPVISG